MEDAVIGGISVKVELEPITSSSRGGRRGKFFAENENASRLLERFRGGRTDLDYESTIDGGSYVRTGRVRIWSCREKLGAAVPAPVEGDFEFTEGPKVSRK